MRKRNVGDARKILRKMENIYANLNQFLPCGTLKIKCWTKTFVSEEG